MVGFQIRNKDQVIFPRQSQVHQADVEMVAGGLHNNGVLRGCEIEHVPSTMYLQLVQTDVPIYRGVDNMIVYELIVYDVDRLYEIQTEMATPQLLTIPDGDATYGRFDLIWASPAGIHIATGAPAALPIKTSVPIQELGPAGGRPLGVALYEVFVPAGATDLNSGNLEDKRVFVNRPRDHYVWLPISTNQTGEPAGGEAGIS